MFSRVCFLLWQRTCFLPPLSRHMSSSPFNKGGVGGIYQFPSDNFFSLADTTLTDQVSKRGKQATRPSCVRLFRSIQNAIACCGRDWWRSYCGEWRGSLSLPHLVIHNPSHGVTLSEALVSNQKSSWVMPRVLTITRGACVFTLL